MSTQPCESLWIQTFTAETALQTVQSLWRSGRMEHHAAYLQAIARMSMWKLVFSTSLFLPVTALRNLPVGQSIAFQVGRALLQDANSTDTVNGEDHKRLPVISIVVGAVAAGLALLFVIFTTIGFFQNRWEVKIVDAQQHHRQGAQTAPPFMMASAPEKFSYKELQSGTINFTEKLGRGGKVYKGVLSNTTDVAVKRLNEYPRLEFEHDVKKVAAVRNRCLVHLFGYCLEGDHRLLVYEYLPKGALSNFLYASPAPDPDRCVLSWGTRFRIALSIARVLAFLHDHCHGDEKLKYHGRVHSENILLTENYDAKLADFGFSRHSAGREQPPPGTLEYFSPEWWGGDLSRAVRLTSKSDVYSFGILLLEILCGRRIGDFYRSTPSWEFPDFAHAFDVVAAEPDAIAGLLDPELTGAADPVQLRSILKAAYWCVQPEGDSRPTMATLVAFLEGRLGMQTPPTPSASVVFFSTRHGSSHLSFRPGRGPHRVEIVNAR